MLRAVKEGWEGGRGMGKVINDWRGWVSCTRFWCACWALLLQCRSHLQLYFHAGSVIHMFSSKAQAGGHTRAEDPRPSMTPWAPGLAGVVHCIMEHPEDCGCWPTRIGGSGSCSVKQQ